MHPRLTTAALVAVFLLLIAQVSLAQTANFTSDVTQGCFPVSVKFTDTSTGPVASWSWDFGNGNTSTLQNPSAVFSTPGNYTVTLSVSNGGAPNTVIKSNYIVVHDFPVVDFDFDVASGCAPLTVNFRDKTSSPSGVITSWQWVFGDGGTSTRANPTYVYNLPGTRVPSLRVKNEFGCESFKTATTSITPLGPTPKFTIDKTSECTLPATFQFTNQSTGNAPTYLWSFGDGTTSTDVNPSHTYNTQNTFTITLKAQDANGCIQTTQQSVNAGNQGGLDFTASTFKVCLGDAIDFTLVSSDAPIHSNWVFGDGGTSSVNDPHYTYTTAGAFTVTLKSLLLNHTCESFASKTVIVAAPAVPVITSSLDCNYNLTLKSDQSQNTNHVEWYVEDELVSTAIQFVSPIHTPGGQDVRLLAFDAAGCSVELDNIVNIPANPSASFKPIDQQACDGLSLSGCAPFSLPFTNTTHSDDPVTFQWDFGDNSTSTAANPTHTFLTKGLFQVTLTATNGKGCSGVSTAFVVVADQTPVADFDISTKVACAGEEVTFTDKSTGTADYWCWDFGNGDKRGGTDKQVVYKFPKPGVYTVTLIAKNAGCSSQKTKVNVIRIRDPLVDYNFFKSCADPHTVNLINKSAFYNSMHWDFGDGQTSSVIDVGSHHYAAEGVYTLTLIGTNDTTGCETHAFTSILIQDVKADFEANTDHPCKGSPISFTDESHAVFKYDWTIAGTKFDIPNPSIKIKVPGDYTASLQVTDSDGCRDTKSIPFTVVNMEGDFSFTAESTCDEFIVDFKNFSTGTPPPTGWSWDFGDGGTSADKEPTHDYNAVGKYPVSLTVTNADGSCTFSKDDAVNFTVPIPSFETAKTTFCINEVVIAANTTKNAVSYDWDFGDGRREENVVSPTIQYSTTGNYTLTLLARDAFGCERKLQKENIVNIEKPTADFKVLTSKGDCPPFTATFTDQSQINITKWDWDFGNSNTSTLQNPANVYLEPGAFDVKLTITDDKGCTDTKVINKLVNVGGPYGSFTTDGMNTCTNQTLTFTATTTNTTKMNWDFGDGVVQENNSTTTTHVYTKLGTVVPNLLLTDANGCKTVAKGSSPITIKDTTAVSTKISPLCIHTEEPFILSGKNETDDDDLSWSWELDGVSLGSGNNLQSTIHDPGLYVIKGEASNQFNCISRTVDTVRIQGPIKMIPNVFTPNETDNTNATFQILGIENSIWNIDIVNRWGSLVYRKQGYNGEWAAEDQPAGVYYYVLRNALCNDVTYKGYISVVK